MHVGLDSCSLFFLPNYTLNDVSLNIAEDLMAFLIFLFTDICSNLHQECILLFTSASPLVKSSRKHTNFPSEFISQNRSQYNHNPSPVHLYDFLRFVSCVHHRMFNTIMNYLHTKYPLPPCPIFTSHALLSWAFAATPLKDGITMSNALSLPLDNLRIPRT